jgi:adenylylsulfate kinase-like enzyme
MRGNWPLLWLCGPSGVGKSTVGFEIFTQLGREGIAAGYVDADQLGLCYPAPAEDPENHRVKARNLGAMAPVLREAGSRCLVFSGGVDGAEDARHYAEAVPGAALTVVRLRVGIEELRARFLGRGWMRELLAENEAVAAALDRSDFADLTIDSEGLSVPETARLVRERTGASDGHDHGHGHPWPTPTPAVRGTRGASVADPAPGGPGSISGARPDPPGAELLPDGLCPAPAPASPATRSIAECPPHAVAHPPVPVLWVCGAPCVGKSEVAWAVFARLFGSGVTAAYVDLAQLGFRRPAPADDPDGHRLRARALAAVWPAYRAAGARCLILSGGVAHPDAVRAYAEAVPGAALTLVRLHAGPEALRERALLRGRGGGPAVPGDELRGRPAEELLRHAEAASREAEALDRAGFGDVRVATDGRTVEAIAADVSSALTRPEGP